MPLTRANVTAASRIMLPVYVVLTTTFGLVYVIDPGDRLAQAPAVTFQRNVLPLWAWGAVMLMLAALMLFAFQTRSRLMFEFALSCCAVTWALWGFAIGASIFLTPNTSWLAPVLPFFVTTASLASMVSLLAGEK